MARGRGSRRRRSGPRRAPPPQPSSPPSLATGAATPYPAPGGGALVHAGAVLLLVAVTLALYAPALELGFFHWDDPHYVTDNPRIQGLSADHLRRVLTEPYFANYSPSHLLSYMLDHAVGGLDPRVYHLSSHLWAGACAAGVYLLALLLLGHPAHAFAAGLLFALHPAHVEAVAWISSRKDLVAAAFALPSMAAYVHARRTGGRPAYVVSVGLFVVAVAGKLSVAVVPAVLFLLDVFWERRRGWGPWLDKLPYLLPAAAIAGVVAGVQPDTRQAFEPYVFAHSILQSLWLLTGFGETVLARGRPDPPATVLVHGLVLVGAAAVFLLPLLPWRRVPAPPRVFLAWIALALVPSQALSFIHPVADRYLFFPSAGAILLVVWGGAALARRGDRRTTAALAVGLAILAGLWTRATLAYLDEWRDPRSVWHAASTRSADVAPILFLGAHYQDRADALDALPESSAERARAEALARSVWREDPRLAALLDEWAAGVRGPLTDAFQEALRARARERLEAALARKGDRVLPNLHLRMARLAVGRGDLDEALTWYERAFVESRRHTLERFRQEQEAGIYYSVGMVHAAKGDCVRALKWLAQAAAAQAALDPPPVPSLERDRRRLAADCPDYGAAGDASPAPSPPR